MRLRENVRRCFPQCRHGHAFGADTIFFLLIIHILIGWKRLRDVMHYRDDPLVKHVLGLKKVPDVSTLTRTLCGIDEASLRRVQAFSEEVVMARMEREALSPITVDFDGCVQSTRGRTIEGTAVGYNTKRKGARSYYPLFATVAQTGQVLRILHRPGNVHDSAGAAEFIHGTFERLKKRAPRARLEARVDSAHFNEATCLWLHQNGIEFIASVPFERFAVLKGLVEDRRRWRRIDQEWSYFELPWRPKAWTREIRLLIFRHRIRRPRKGPIQLDLFVPFDEEYEFKAVATNKKTRAGNVLLFHNGRGSQEGVFAETKSDCFMDYIPCRHKIANEVWLQATVLAYNMHREFQMTVKARARPCAPKRPTVFLFETLKSFRNRILRRAGRLTWPGARPTLIVSARGEIANEITGYMSILDP